MERHRSRRVGTRRQRCRVQRLPRISPGLPGRRCSPITKEPSTPPAACLTNGLRMTCRRH